MDLKATRNELTGRWSLEGVEPSEVTFERICRMLKEGENFKFARYGDGEFNCMFSKQGQNCDGHEYFPDLGTALNNAFYSSPHYMVGIQPLAVQSGMWERAIQREGYPKIIYDADALHSASIDGKLHELIEALGERYVVLVGPEHLHSFCDKNDFGFLDIPDKNCWRAINNTLGKIEMATMLDDDLVFLLCCSMMSEVIIDHYSFMNHTFIDCGSVFDPYVGKFSRRYHHKLQLNAN